MTVLLRQQNALDLWDILSEGGMTIEDARLALQRAQRRRIGKGCFYAILADIRLPRRYEEYSYTITPCKKGRDGSGYIFATLRRADGTLEITEEMREHFNNGAHSATATIHQMMANHAAQLRCQGEQETDMPTRELYFDNAETFEFAVRKLKRMLTAMEREAA